MIRKDDEVLITLDRENPERVVVGKFRVTKADEGRGLYLMQFLDVLIEDSSWDPKEAPVNAE